VTAPKLPAKYEGDVIAIPLQYLSDFRSDSVDALLKYGSMPQRARTPWFTDVEKIDAAMRLPDVVVGAAAEQVDPKMDYRALVAASDANTLLNGVAETFRSDGSGFWSCHVDLALGKKREGDAAGIALGRITEDYTEKATDPLMNRYERIVRAFEVPFVAQIVAPVGSQIFISSIVRFILQLKQVRGFNITSFSFDGFNSAMAAQELMLAGLVTAGMDIDPQTGEIVGIPKPFSVDRSPQPYRELLEAVNEGRVLLPKYELLRKEMRELESTKPGRAPDHGKTSTKDALDAVAGVVGYLAAFGHAVMSMPEDVVVDRHDIEQAYELEPTLDFRVGNDEKFGLDFNEGMDSFEDFLDPAARELFR
jgi:hypothetical protein